MALETLPVLGYQIEDLGKVCFFFSENFATFEHYHSAAPWVRKFGYLCIQEILFLTKSSVRTHVRPFMLADVRHACHYIDSCQNKVDKVVL